MNRIRRIGITFLLVISLSVIIHFTSDKTAKEPAAIKTIEVAPPVDGPELRAVTPDAGQIKKILTVYCFSDNQNDPNASFVREAIERNFAAELKSGVVVIKVIAADSAEEQRLMQEFKPVPPATILAVSINGQTADWKKISSPATEKSEDGGAYLLKAIRELLEKSK